MLGLHFVLGVRKAGATFLSLASGIADATEDHPVTFEPFPPEAPPETDCIIVIIGIP